MSGNGDFNVDEWLQSAFDNHIIFTERNYELSKEREEISNAIDEFVLIESNEEECHNKNNEICEKRIDVENLNTVFTQDWILSS